jgi:hypothetical protein
MPSFIEIGYETHLNSFVRHVLEANDIAQKYMEIVNDDKKFFSEKGHRINNRLFELEDMFQGRKKMPRHGQITIAKGMIGEINIPLPTRRFDLFDSSRK